jgi:hypothetical protein
MKNSLFIIALLSVLSCKNNNTCERDWASCLNSCLVQEIKADSTCRSCKEDAQFVLRMEIQRCMGLPSIDESITCRMLATLQAERMHFHCDSIRALRIGEINHCRYECNAHFLACIQN